MDTTTGGKQGDSVSADMGQIKLQIRTARVQKHIIVDENITIKDVSSMIHF